MYKTECFLWYVMNAAGGLSDPSAGGGSSLKPYLKRKKSSFGDTRIAVLGQEGVGKSGKLLLFVFLDNDVWIESGGKVDDRTNVMRNKSLKSKTNRSG